MCNLSFYVLTGRVKAKSAPPITLVATPMLPLWSMMILWQRLRPMPVEFSLVVKKGSKIFLARSWEIPGPESEMDTLIQSP